MEIDQRGVEEEIWNLIRLFRKENFYPISNCGHLDPVFFKSSLER
ncbi:hypothetical protein LEP1GSC109_0007 [Leptospira interrogans str. UI 13372]|uniref:Uncharacterized protein n=5 Tax=Leptospira interrogans TaxID=173 RepID=A0A0E2D5V4_LEPIR|nr:hypothetical protein G436_4058 [Leptospira interrogans serovar Hardjo str. Norma]EJP02125.1 hypothetical protein LEP1GSC007_3498 [Leptospira interrogans serovar Bulgarica str. Mallika]EKO25581.1 hypothetical protein LEP1GSC104_4738 [Leptospira interrogans str. UI 12621]EKO97795.1 hypothetical protein LEP1GSC057_2715 [Leptospira interrogans str. Brem 329]EKR16592.1 hypothetical protein LEP1GSC019_1483 [Leptospira interrogans serovar Pyrogenes str. 2006006960]EKR55288.1 hypothetical protein L